MILIDNEEKVLVTVRHSCMPNCIVRELPPASSFLSQEKKGDEEKTLIEIGTDRAVKIEIGKGRERKEGNKKKIKEK